MSIAIEVEPMNATDAKNRFGDLLAAAVDNKAVSLMRHGKPAAYVISPALYERAIASLKAAPSALQRLERDFEQLIAGMQEPQNIAAMKELMSIDTATLHAGLRPAQAARRKAKPRG